MNCENCKKLQSTVFYADESGRQHSLCASCARSLGKLSRYEPDQNESEHGSEFFPRPSLVSLKRHTFLGNIYFTERKDAGRSVCPHCSTSLETAVSTGRVGCPECYTVFSELIIPSSASAETAHGARMPSSRRERFDRIRSISELKTQIKLAVESENYELAATLRDKIRKLESVH